MHASCMDCALLCCPFNWSWSDKADWFQNYMRNFGSLTKFEIFLFSFLWCTMGSIMWARQLCDFSVTYFINSSAGRRCYLKLWLSDLKKIYPVPLNDHDMKQLMRTQSWCLCLFSHWKLPLYYQILFTSVSVDVLVTDLAVSIVAGCEGLVLHGSNSFILRATGVRKLLQTLVIQQLL